MTQLEKEASAAADEELKRDAHVPLGLHASPRDGEDFEREWAVRQDEERASTASAAMLRMDDEARANKTRVPRESGSWPGTFLVAGSPDGKKFKV